MEVSGGLLDEKVLAQYIKARTMSEMIRELEEDRERGIHVTDIVYDCLRRGYLNILNSVHEQEFEGDEKTLVTLWIGKMLHKIVLSKEHELEMSYMGVSGTLDEAWVLDDDGERVLLILDKKTTAFKTTEPMSHHVEQVKYYAVMYTAIKNEEFDRVYGAIEYFNVDTKELMPFVFSIDLDDARRTFESKVEAVSEALKSDKGLDVIPAVHSWLCKYCRWLRECMIHDSAVLGGEEG